MADLGLPKIEVVFKSLSGSAITRSAKGIVALIIKDDTDITFDFAEYKSIDEIETAKFTETNVNYIKDVFLGNPSKVIVCRMATDGVLTDLLTKVKGKFFNWIGIAEGVADEQQTLATWTKNIIATGEKAFLCLVYNTTTSPDYENVCNFTNARVKPKNGDWITGEKYISRFLGFLAGTPMTESATYKILSELEEVEEPTDVEASINNGELILINDEGIVRIARAVNSLVTVGQDKSDDFKKIAIIEAMNLMLNDIRNTFKNHYLGKYKNSYDKQLLFISAINGYFRDLARESILDGNVENLAFVDVEAQRNALISIGKPAENWKDIDVKVNTVGSKVFLAGNIKILDAMEDLKFNIYM